MLAFLDRIPLPGLLSFAIILGLASFFPEPYLTEWFKNS